MPEDWEEEYYEEDWACEDYEDTDSLCDLEEQEYYINVLEPQLHSLNGRD